MRPNEPEVEENIKKLVSREREAIGSPGFDHFC